MTTKQNQELLQVLRERMGLDTDDRQEGSELYHSAMKPVIDKCLTDCSALGFKNLVASEVIETGLMKLFVEGLFEATLRDTKLSSNLTEEQIGLRASHAAQTLNSAFVDCLKIIEGKVLVQ